MSMMPADAYQCLLYNRAAMYDLLCASSLLYCPSNSKAGFAVLVLCATFLSYPNLLSVVSTSSTTTTATNDRVSDAHSYNKKSWKVFWDLQCPYSKKNWELLPKIREQFEADYDFSIHLSSLLFHPQAFVGQCGAHVIAAKKGEQARLKFIDACFENQALFMNAAIGDARKSEVDAIFAGIAEKLEIFDVDDDDEAADEAERSKKLTKTQFLASLHDWDRAIKPAWTEHKEALALGVHAVPKSVIDGVLVTDSESDWGPDRCAEALESLKKRKADDYK